MLIGGVAGAYRIETVIQLVAMVLLVVAAVVAGLLGRVVAGTFGGASILLVALGASLVTGGFGGGLGAMVASILIVIAAKRGLAQPRRTIGPIHRLAYRIARLPRHTVRRSRPTRCHASGEGPAQLRRDRSLGGRARRQRPPESLS